MKKYLLTLATFISCATCLAAIPEATVDRMRSFYVHAEDQGSHFQLSMVTRHDMPNAIALEIATMTVTRPTGNVPGILSLVVRPAGDMWIEMIGPQYGYFSFSKGNDQNSLPQYLPLGRYRLEVNGEVCGMLIVESDDTYIKPLPYVLKTPPEA